MAGSSIGTNTGGGTISLTGLASGLNTSSIISALIAAERQPVTQMTIRQEKLQASQGVLAELKGSLQRLSFAVSELALPSLFESGQTASSSEPLRIEATVTSGAAVGGYQVEVKQLATAARRSFTFASPAAEETVTVEGREYKIAAGATAQSLAAKINADGSGKVWAAVTETNTIALSMRETGASGAEYVKVTGASLTEVAGSAHEGHDAEYAVDGAAGTSHTNTLKGAIPGVTLTLKGVTTTSGPVTVDVQPPAPSVSGIESQIQSFVKLYNSTVESIEKQLTTKPPKGARSASEYAIGTLFGNTALSGFLGKMRASMYQAIGGLPAEMASPADIGLSPGAATGSSSQAAVEGQLKLDPTKLANAVQSNPAGAKAMLAHWATGLQSLIETVGGPGGMLETSISSDEGQFQELRRRISAMNAAIEVHQADLVQTYAKLEGIISRNSSQNSWLASQSEGLIKSGR